jgi:hypothetical protein
VNRYVRGKTVLARHVHASEESMQCSAPCTPLCAEACLCWPSLASRKADQGQALHSPTVQKFNAGSCATPSQGRQDIPTKVHMLLMMLGDSKQEAMLGPLQRIGSPVQCGYIPISPCCYFPAFKTGNRCCSSPCQRFQQERSIASWMLGTLQLQLVA